MSKRSDTSGDTDDVSQKPGGFPFGCPLHRSPRGPHMFSSFFTSRSRGEWIPAVDIAEHKDSYTLISDLPEMTKEDVRVYTDGPTAICISGTRQRRAELRDSPLIVAERGAGRFERCFELPSKLDESNVKASFKDAQLLVTLPKLSSSKGASSSSIKIE